MSAGSRLHRNARSTVTRPGRAPGKQRINIGNEKLPTTGNAIRSLIRARYRDGNRCARAPLGGVQGTAPTRWKPLGEGGARGPGQRGPHSWLRVGHGPQNQPETPAGSSGAGRSSRQGAVSLWGCGGAGPGPPLPARGFWMGPAAPWVCSCPPAGPVWAGQGPACQAGPLPSFPQRQVPLASPFQLAQGAACRASSSEGSVLSRGHRRAE